MAPPRHSCQAEMCLSPVPLLAKALGHLVPKASPAFQGMPSHQTVDLTIESNLLAWGQLLGMPTKGDRGQGLAGGSLARGADDPSNLDGAL